MMQYLPPRRIAAIHDLSSVGRCALTVVMPTLSVMGYQVIPIPTALLSTHTGGFSGMHFRDLTEDMHAMTEHFSRLDMRFGAIYTGFLGSEAQIFSVKEILERFSKLPDETGKSPLVLIDPVMGDDGVLYSTYTEALVKGIRALSAHAEILTPNLTEACLLTDTPYRNTAEMSERDVKAFADLLLEKLRCEVSLHAEIVITGVEWKEGEVACFGEALDGRRFCVSQAHEGRAYPGTGDIFASVLLGERMRERSFEDSCRRAADFVATLIRHSSKIATPERMGVALEPDLYLLAERQERE